jgi:hypothetical protein
VPSRDPTRVYLTVDVECREERLVRGHLEPAAGYDLRVFGRFANQREELGLGLILDALEARAFRGTFFIDPFGAGPFGEEGFREACQTLLGRGHDVQLHAHPVQASPRWHSRGERPRLDDIGAYDQSTQEALLAQGIEILTRAGVPRPSIRAFRAGNYGADNRTWEAMGRVGLVLGSSYNPCYLDRSCRLRTDRASPDLFLTDCPGVWELPIGCFTEVGGRRPRHFQITAVSCREMIHGLEATRALGVHHVTIITHSFEFLLLDSVEARLGRPNTLNIKRLHCLLDYLSAHPQEFVVETVGSLAERLASGFAEPATRAGYPRGRGLLRASRYCEQLAKRLIVGLR